MDADTVKVGSQRAADLGTNPSVQWLTAATRPIDLTLHIGSDIATFHAHSDFALNGVTNHPLHSPIAVSALQSDDLFR